MADKKKEQVKAQTNFDVWKQSLTLEFVASSKFITLSCGCCPASGVTCNKYDKTCRGSFLLWAKAAYTPEEVADECEN